MKTVLLIGGAGSVIGRHLEKKLFVDGHKIVATWYSKLDPDWTASSSTVVRKLDVTDTQSVTELVDEIESGYGGIDILINCAAVSAAELVPISSAERWNHVIDVNLLGTYRTCKAVSRKMAAKRSGRIINICSIKSNVIDRGESAYAASKAGVGAFTRCLAVELSASNIQVNAVCPGFIRSRINGFGDDLAQRAKAESLLGIEHNLDDVVNFISFLCSDALQAVTGQIFNVDSRLH